MFRCSRIVPTPRVIKRARNYRQNKQNENSPKSHENAIGKGLLHSNAKEAVASQKKIKLSTCDTNNERPGQVNHTAHENSWKHIQMLTLKQVKFVSILPDWFRVHSHRRLNYLLAPDSSLFLSGPVSCNAYLKRTICTSCTRNSPDPGGNKVDVDGRMKKWTKNLDLDLLSPDHMKIHNAHMTAIKDGKTLYIDPSTGYEVTTIKEHLTRGYCCGHVCRHCPYEHVNAPPQFRNMMNHNTAFYY